MIDKECLRCGAYDPDFGCTMPGQDKWYACKIEASLPENQAKLQEMIDFYEELENGNN